MAVRRDQLYVYPTWLARLMTGEVSCEWATWYRAHYKDWNRPLSDFDEARYQMEHTRLAREMRLKRDPTQEKLFVERQGTFWYTHSSGIRISGTPDLVSLNPVENCIYEAKAFKPHSSHRLQVLIYMYCAARSDNAAFRGKRFAGLLQYKDYSQYIEPGEASGQFEELFNYWLNLLASNKPLEKTPSEQECRFCNIGLLDCPERLAETSTDEA